MSFTPQSIYALSYEQWQAWCLEQGIRKYRAEQIFRWIYRRRASSFADMSDLPAELREKLAEHFVFHLCDVESHQIASDRTEKLLLKLPDGECVECVLMREPKRNTICISTQVGCAMGCVFCASGLAGLTRNLS